MKVKRRPHHNLIAVKVKFSQVETAHSPKNSKVWHDTYRLLWGDHWLYLKFAGETLIDVTLTSFKEVGHG